MKRNIIMAAVALAAATSSAQNLYQVEALTSEDLNGTARFVGMGGAMGALGADMSTMGTNPAGIGLYRKCDLAVSASVLHQVDGPNVLKKKATYGSFDNIGLVYSNHVNNSWLKFLNIGFNYHKRKNFHNTQFFQGNLNGLSQSLEMLDLSKDYVTGEYLDLKDDKDKALTSPIAHMGYEVGMLREDRDVDGKVKSYSPMIGSNYRYVRALAGSINQYDFNISANIIDRVYIGMTVGVYDVDYRNSYDYSENYIYDKFDGTYLHQADEKISGNGVDFKMGVVVRPIEYFPLRIGVSFSTPTFYDLTSKNSIYMKNEWEGNIKPFDWEYTTPSTDFKVRTPWKVNCSIGGNVGNYLALDAEYEYANYSTCSVSYPEYDDVYQGYGHDSYKDVALNNDISNSLKAVHTLKLGAEIRVLDNMSLRLGYNYITSSMKPESKLDLVSSSPSATIAVGSAYTNLGAINRYTCGLGYNYKHFYADVAYQYQTQTAEFYPFYVPEGKNSIVNKQRPVKTNWDRHSGLFTIGFRF